ncbi:MAG: hypothetical protein A3D31_06300 [Candidatus Fluviicola riflensis]|nr:MAG: hypothetical protein CHH17_08715 [Candidatus Fluviicola riflensis]OGS79574.1 MAG: hypothetical protein A3D31_06300 [Candidatus Fluviicola riflensis]OGS87005.1 MAG: hypothetical protein A2724_05760 [Fluviicola sp. RIFCSPHIGHO2_01_FULL_43_53]OGS89796.1 MAG: hypothetical protein A3E30_02505 [Fluviicola sp. RIFCSPHIGHO2_12_FULL_43_24]
MSEESIDQGINLSSSELKITEYIRKDLTTAAKWGKFLAIIGFVVVGLMFIAALFMLISAATMPSFISGQFFLMGFVYIIMAVIFVFPTLYLLRFSNSTQTGLRSENQVDFEFGIENLRSLFKFMGIYTIVVLGLYTLIILFGAFSALA